MGLETEQKEIQEAQGENQQPQAPPAPQSVGTLLKSERERLGLSREQITEKTRMRAQIVEALENEAWGALPPPVFVRGFLRTYAKVLGIGQEAVLDLYAKSVPSESSGQVPALEPPRRRRRWSWLVLLLLVFLGALYGVWISYSSSPVRPGSPEPETKDREATAPPAPAHKGASPVTPEPAAQPQVAVRAVEDPGKKEPAPVQSASPVTLPSPKEPEALTRDPVDEGDRELSLTGIVRERTWLRIMIDGKEEKEYLFQPGARPQWRGKEKFYILIGNAGGIDFDLNGKRVGDLGKPGQVIRLTLPKDSVQKERAN
ncbi:MAG: DUF4115 domain-containing protein [Desulfobacterota bacterium]|jgi:cytoskeleton protein RodZ|nr:DUF4115 domain-containing protein [Thermodesulfobacteriota bacterium]